MRAFVPGAEDFLALFHEPGELALGAGPVQRRLVQGKVALGVVVAAVKDSPAGPAFDQMTAAAFPGAGVGGLIFRRLGDYPALGVPGEILGELTPRIAGAT